MQDAKVEARIRRRFRLVAVELDERRRRQLAAAETREVGWGGVSLVARALRGDRLWVRFAVTDFVSGFPLDNRSLGRQCSGHAKATADRI
jgi:hypothetical protein